MWTGWAKLREQGVRLRVIFDSQSDAQTYEPYVETARIGNRGASVTIENRARFFGSYTKSLSTRKRSGSVSYTQTAYLTGSWRL